MRYTIKRYAPVCSAFLILFFCSSGKGQNKPDLPKENLKSQTKDSIISQVTIVQVPITQMSISQAPNSMVRNVRKARNGDMLIASFLGVYRYDGKSFINLTSGISTPSFFDVLEDKNGNIWMASRDSGIYCLNGKSLKHFTTREGLASNLALHIYEDRSGNIWFGTNRYDGKSFRNFTTKDGFPSDNLRLLLEDKTGRLWFGGQGENVFMYDARLNGELGQGKPFNVVKNEDGKTFNSVWSIIEDKKGNIWLAADGICRYDGKTFTRVSQIGAYAILEDKKGNIWTSLGNRIFCYDERTLFDTNPTVTEIVVTGADSFLFGISEDKDGNIWAGARGPESKLYRYDGKTIIAFTDGK